MTGIVRLLLPALALAVAVGLHAQEPEADAPAKPQEPPPAAASVSTAELSSRADEINADVLGVLRSLQQFDERVQSIPGAREQLDEDLETMLAGFGPDEIESLSLSDAESLQQTLLRMTKQLDGWRGQLNTRIDELEAERERLRDSQSFLEESLADAEDLAIPASLRERIDGLIIQLSATRQVVSSRTSVVLDELSAISRSELRIRDVNSELEAIIVRGPGELLSANQQPIWTAFSSEEAVLGDLARGIENRQRSAGEFLKAREADTIAAFVGLGLLLAIALAWRLGWLFPRGRSADTETEQRIFDQRPFAIAILFWSVVGFEVFLERAPVAVGVVRVILVGAALLRMAPIVLGERVRPVVRILIALGVVTVLIDALLDESLAQRLLFILIAVVSSVMFVRLRRQLPVTVETGRQVWLTVSLGICFAAPYAFGVGALALVFGLSNLGHQLVQGSLLLLMALLGVLVLERVLIEIVDAAVDMGRTRGFRSLSRAPEQVKSQLGFFVRLFMLVLLLALLSDVFPSIERVWALVVEFLSSNIGVGTLEFAVVDVLVLLLSAAVAVIVARVIRVLLNEDVLPRFAVQPGAAEAVSRLVYYGLVTAGVMIALGAAGVELSRLTLVISALGVGIGFGLQGIVNNLVSGLILSFERPIQVGDTIVVGNLTGRVTQIGLRATRIRTFDAAEVIVPNADLISSNVVNWTLSDRTRRLDLPVFVAYGSDMEKVRERLLSVAAAHEEIAAAPAPEVLFQGFQDSALELWLRVWMPESGNWPSVRSQLYFAIDAALREAGIEVPFPQRVVHMSPDEQPASPNLTPGT